MAVVEAIEEVSEGSQSQASSSPVRRRMTPAQRKKMAEMRRARILARSGSRMDFVMGRQTELEKPPEITHEEAKEINRTAKLDERATDASSTKVSNEIAAPALDLLRQHKRQRDTLSQWRRTLALVVALLCALLPLPVVAPLGVLSRSALVFNACVPFVLAFEFLLWQQGKREQRETRLLQQSHTTDENVDNNAAALPEQLLGGRTAGMLAKGDIALRVFGVGQRMFQDALVFAPAFLISDFVVGKLAAPATDKY
ncbi:MAG: hypothetical protein MHM6MM_001106 [Cercozoa sp. M6MM]